MNIAENIFLNKYLKNTGGPQNWNCSSEIVHKTKGVVFAAGIIRDSQTPEKAEIVRPTWPADLWPWIPKLAMSSKIRHNLTHMFSKYFAGVIISMMGCNYNNDCDRISVLFP